MYRIVLLIGGNLGDRVQFIKEVHKRLIPISSIVTSSSLYETEAWGEASETPYLNQAMIVQTSTPPSEFILLTQNIENQLGRTREVRWGDRTMDIDILYVDNLICEEENLTLPHPMIAQRRFVLVPLTEILPDFIHPVLRVSNKELLFQCTDESLVKLYSDQNPLTAFL